MATSKTKQIVLLRHQINTWPNALSVLRLLIALEIFFLLREGSLWIAFYFFGVGVITDAADGIIARKYNQITNLGKVLDPAADKIFFLATSYRLIPSGFIWWWGVILGLETILIFIGLFAFLKEASEKKQEIFWLGANIYGKLKMAAEMVLATELFLSKLGLIKLEPVLLHTLFGIVASYAILSMVRHLKFKKE